MLRTVRWSPHYGVCITLNIDYTAQGETLNTGVRHTGKVRTHLAGKRHHAGAFSTEANPAVILDRKTPAARAPNRQTWLLEEAETLGHASETWSVATALYRVREGRKVDIARTGSFPIFRMKPVFRDRRMSLDSAILKGGGIVPLARPADLDTLCSPQAPSSSRRATSLWPMKS